MGNVNDMETIPGEARLEPVLVGDITGLFFVPAYQRGYRWGRDEVKKLLDDIWESRGKSYYLQPVVVKKYGDEWELVDGQQRLTTLFLIFQYMKHEGLQNSGAGYSLRYETREDSAGYIEAPDPELSRQNIDFFHIFEAYNCIKEWFEAHGHRRQFVANEVYGALFEHVKVIWYEAPEDVDGNTLFRRLNVGRIPLTDAELVKAVLLSRSRRDADGGDRAFEIAAQWDSFERDLRDPEVWAFITGKASQDPTHIDLLLDSIAGGPTGRDRAPFYTFDTLKERISTDPYSFWNEVVEMHAVALGWHANRDLFHKIGFLIAQRVTTFSGLLVQARGKNKSVFEAELNGLIRLYLNLTATGLRDLTYQSDKTGRVLLLMNVETIRQRKHSFERYSFSEHAAGRWSLEHIHAQSAEGIRRSKDQWATWLYLHRRALEALDDVDQATKQTLLAETDDVLAASDISESNFQDLERRYTTLLSIESDTSEDAMHSIANLALLQSGNNSALSNSVFAVKRAEILELDQQGSYIPVCTRDVFLKYYSPADEHQMHFWSTKDREHYLDAMRRVLGDYLLDDEEAAS
jgi:Protein of unknown function DUF262/Protein of unknown function (DUF1524)